MKKNELFDQYEKYLFDLATLSSSMDKAQEVLTSQERKRITEINKEYSETLSDLQIAKRTIDSQYRSVLESCTNNAGLHKPVAQRPSYTDKGLQECIRIQEKSAVVIQEWFSLKTQQILAEKKKKMQEEAATKEAMALSAKEAEHKKKQEAEALEKARGAQLVEELKRKYKTKN